MMLMRVMLICMVERNLLGLVVSVCVILVVELLWLVVSFSCVGWVEMIVSLDMVNRLLSRISFVMMRMLV